MRTGVIHVIAMSSLLERRPKREAYRPAAPVATDSLSQIFFESGLIAVTHNCGQSPNSVPACIDLFTPTSAAAGIARQKGQSHGDCGQQPGYSRHAYRVAIAGPEMRVNIAGVIRRHARPLAPSRRHCRKPTPAGEAGPFALARHRRFVSWRSYLWIFGIDSGGANGAGIIRLVRCSMMLPVLPFSARYCFQSGSFAMAARLASRSPAFS